MAVLTKTDALRGMRCLKSLWLSRFRPAWAAPLDEGGRAQVEEGRLVGELARRHVPGGVLVDEADPAAAVERTRRLLAEGARLLYEAAFEHEGVLVRVDVLRRRDDGRFDLLEAKKTLQPKEEHLADVAVQRHVVEGAGLRVAFAGLVLLDPAYVRGEELDPSRLFRVHDVTEGSDPTEGDLRPLLEGMRAILEPGRSMPEVEISAGRCRNPYACAFVSRCWEGVPEWSIYDLHGIAEKDAASLRAQGLLRPDQVPDSVRVPAKAAAYVAVAKDGRERFDAAFVRDFLGRLRWPLHFLDFETIGPAVPPFPGTVPYDVIPFQFSLHVQERPGEAPRHVAFLADGAGDPRRDVAERLAAAVGREGDVVCWTYYEATCLRRLADASAPETAAVLKSVASRLVDLAIPFRERAVVLPAAQGSYSLKRVYPALSPGSGWDDLEMQDGMAAARAYGALRDPATGAAERSRLRSSLERYCARDTEATLRVLEALRARLP